MEAKLLLFNFITSLGFERLGVLLKNIFNNSEFLRMKFCAFPIFIGSRQTKLEM